MAKKEKDIFYKYQDQVIENLETLKINLENCEDLGMLDMDETIYNELVDLIEDARAADNLENLSELITRAKTIESNIDSWYSKEGLTNVELSWPLI